MRTVVENRHGLGETVENMPRAEYVHLNQNSPKCRSCFYNFGERKQLSFVVSSGCSKIPFIESLKEQFC